MTVTDFIRKAYGGQDITHLRVYISLPGNPHPFLVNRARDEKIDLYDYEGHYRFLNSDNPFIVNRVSTEGGLVDKKTILHLDSRMYSKL